MFICSGPGEGYSTACLLLAAKVVRRHSGSLYAGESGLNATLKHLNNIVLRVILYKINYAFLSYQNVGFQGCQDHLSADIISIKVL